jgi:PAS domain S-box-containing protein
MMTYVSHLEAGNLPCDVDPELPMPIRGLRAEAYSLASVVYDNDFTNSEWSRFMPPGHVELRNVMFAPLIVAEKVVGIIGLANKPADFTDQDADIAQALADMAALSLRRTWDEQALRESEERFSLAFQTSPYAITITRVSDGRFVEVNDTFASVIGYSREEAVGRTTRELDMWVESADRDGIVAEIAAGRPVRDREVDLRAKDGKVVHTLFSVDLIKLGDDLCFLASVSDITERVRAREEREHLQEQLLQAQKIESVGRLAGGIAHDLNNLLVPILGYSDMLLEDCPPDADTRAPLEAISHASTRARDLVQQLLAFSRKQVLEFVSIDLNELLRRFERLLRSTIREDIAISLLLEDAVPLIRGDVGQIEQVVMNLAVNARDAMPNGGTLTIQTSVAELDDEYVASHPDAQPGRYVTLTVTDTGAGMDAETREHIFEPFFTTKATPLGTGLGLATVYGIVKQHGGTIYVYSEPGCGATFRVYLPVSDQEPSPVAVPAATPARVHGSERILLVEDDEQVRELARSVLARQGYQVITAVGGAEAISLMDGREDAVDLLLTDVVMPEMSGKDLFDHLAVTHPDLRVLYMSGYTDDVIAHRGVIDEGVNFIQKPFTVQALAARVRQVLDHA